MKISTINKLCCHFDKSDLQLTTIHKDLEEKIIEGFLYCNNCQRIYPIIKGIPIMNPDEYRESKLEAPLLKKWEQHLKERKIENFRLVSEELEQKRLNE